MTVQELIDMLQKYPEHIKSSKVFFSYDYGDYWHTDVAEEVTKLEVGGVEWSEYHRMYSVLQRDAGGGAYDLTEEEAKEKAEKIIEGVILT